MAPTRLGSSIKTSTLLGRASTPIDRDTMQGRARSGQLLIRKDHLLERWRESRSVKNPEIADNGIDIDQPTRQAVIDALKQLKINKTPGPDGLPAELLKHARNMAVDVLYGIVQSAWNNETMPVECMEGAFYPLHKKKDKLLCENFQRISLLNLG